MSFRNFRPARRRRGRALAAFFGMIPNFEPDLILPRLAGLVRGEDWLLLSANLAPGPDYAAGVQRILPGYDNPLTRDWLTAFLFDLGFAPEDGEVRIAIEDSAAGFKRVAADFYLTTRRALTVYGEPLSLEPGEEYAFFFLPPHAGPESAPCSSATAQGERAMAGPVRGGGRLSLSAGLKEQPVTFRTSLANRSVCAPAPASGGARSARPATEDGVARHGPRSATPTFATGGGQCSQVVANQGKVP